MLPLLEQGADALILGCTHYPFLLPAIRHITGNDIEILETGRPVAEQLKRILKQHDLQKIVVGDGKISDYKCKLSFYNSSPNQHHHLAMQKLWRNPNEEAITILDLPNL
jgi:glutamate racemase